VAEKQQASPLILLAIYGTVNYFYEDTTHSPAPYTLTTHTGLEMMPGDVVSFGKFPCFIFYCFTSKWYSIEKFFSLLAAAYFLHSHTFRFTMRNFLAASQLFVFSVQLTIGLNCAHNFAQFYSKCRSHL